MRDCRRARTTSARPTTRTTPSGFCAQFKAWGWDAQIESFDVLFPTPKERLLEMVAPTKFTAHARGTGRRPAIRRRGQKSEQLPTYNAYSIDGDVTAPLVYVNYGVPAGLRRARAARHLGEGRDRHRALRRLLARHQAEGRRRARRRRLPHLLRPDATTATSQGEVVSRTVRMRPKDGVQRGSVMDMPVYPGDPLTPGVGATQGREAPRPARTPRRSRRSRCCRSRTATRSRCSRRSTGPVAPEGWRGALPITYHVGPGPAQRAPQGRVQLGPEAALRRDRDACPEPSIPTSGSSAAITTTPG